MQLANTWSLLAFAVVGGGSSLAPVLAAPTAPAAPTSSSVATMPPPDFGPPRPGPILVSPSTLEALQIAGSAVIVPDADTLAEISAAGADRVDGLYKLCLTLEGKIKSVVIVRSSRFAAYDANVLATIHNTWRFRPYVPTTELVTEVCTAVSAVYESRPPARNIAASALEATRIAGSKNIAPSADAKAEIRDTGKAKVSGSYDLCTTADGVIDVVIQTESTGAPAYDAEIINAIRREWRYRPLLVNGKATPVCAAATVVYERPAPAGSAPADRTRR